MITMLTIFFWVCVVGAVAALLGLYLVWRWARADEALAEELRGIEPMDREDWERQRELWRRVRKSVWGCNRRRSGGYREKVAGDRL